MEHPHSVSEPTANPPALRPTEILSQEHRVIERVLASLEVMAHRCETQGELDIDDARAVLDFFRHFADGCHHAKEEHTLFPMLEQAGLPKEVGPTAVMRSEHEIGRTAIKRMSEAVEAVATGDDAAKPLFVQNARSYVTLLVEHIEKEDQVLFPMADQMLSPSLQAEVLAGFGNVEEHEVGPGTHDKYLAVSEELAAKYGVTDVKFDRPSHGCVSHCAGEHGPE